MPWHTGFGLGLGIGLGDCGLVNIPASTFSNNSLSKLHVKYIL